MKLHRFAKDEYVMCMANGDWKNKIKNSSTIKSKLWRNAGPSHFSGRRLCWQV